MQTFASERKVLMTRICGLGISSVDAGLILKTVVDWERCSGTEWTVDRLKALKLLYIRRVINREVHYKPEYIKTHRGIPVGPFGRLFRAYPKKVVLSVIQMYTAIVNRGQPTKNQLQKFYSSMEKNTPALSDEYFQVTGFLNSFLPRLFNGEAINKLLREDAERMQTDIHLSDHGKARNLFNDIVMRDMNILSWATSKTRRAPVWSFEGDITSRVESETTGFDHLEYFSNSMSYWQPLIDDHFEVFERIVGDDVKLISFLGEVMVYYNRETSFDPSLVGRISFIQEPGMKLRAVANPFRAVQAVSFSGAHKLWTLLRILEERRMGVYTYSQDSGYEAVKDSIRRRPDLETFSVDLSDATNNFPWFLQYATIKPFLDDIEVQILDKIAQGAWLCPDGVIRRFTVGQPLGAYFSFASFSIAHLGVALMSFWECVQEEPEVYDPMSLVDHIFMVGDDIVLRGHRLYSHYMRLLQVLDVPFSESKTLRSKHCFEFVSRIFDGESDLSTHKWREVTKHNIVDLYPNDSGVRACTDSFRSEVLDWYCMLPEPLGLGRNPKGIPFWDRLVGVEDLWLKSQFELIKPGAFANEVSTTPPSLTQLEPDFFGRTCTVVSCGSTDGEKRYSRYFPMTDRSRESLTKLFSGSQVSMALLDQGLLTRDDILSLVNSPEGNTVLTSNDVSAISTYLLDWYGSRAPIRPSSRWNSVYRMFKNHRSS